MSKIPSEVIHRWLSAGLLTAAELSDAAGVSASMVYKYAEGERDIPMDRARSMSLHACRTKGLTDLADCLLTPAYEINGRGEGRANGCIEDEITDGVEALGGIATHFRRTGDVKALNEHIDAMERTLANVKAECDRLRR